MGNQTICYHCFRELKPGAQFCDFCGHSTADERTKYPNVLPCGTILGGRYIVGHVLGQGGFGITYIAQEYKTKELVAVKEFFPDGVVTRGTANSAVPFSEASVSNFEYGKATFLQEAETLAQFIGNPNIVGVKSYFEENGTAYFAMEYVDGISLQKYLNQHGGKLSWDEMMAIMTPIMRALQTVHSKGIIHRDIKPDNIIIDRKGVVKLLDFGSARYSMGEKSRSLDVVLTHGFAPREQYSRHGRQGAYTDIYALAATMYYVLTGRKPSDSIDRIDDDPLIPPSTLGVRLTDDQEDALLKALAVNPGDRYQNVGSFLQALGAGAGPDQERNQEQKPEQGTATVKVRGPGGTWDTSGREKTPEPEKTVLIIFQDTEGKILAKQNAPIGSQISPPAVQPKQGFRFAGWKPPLTVATEDQAYIAVFERVQETKPERKPEQEQEQEQKKQHNTSAGTDNGTSTVKIREDTDNVKVQDRTGTSAESSAKKLKPAMLALVGALCVVLVIGIWAIMNHSGKKPGTTGEAEVSEAAPIDACELNIYMSSEPAHLDPALNSSVDGACLACNSFEGLMRHNSDGELEPACAESYEVSADGMTYTFTLRDGLKWSNGETLDANDFVYSWQRAASPELAADYNYLCEVFGDQFSYETGLADGAVEASADGKTLTVHLATVCPYFLDLAAFPFFYPVYEGSVEKTADTDNPAGTWSLEASEDFVCNGAFILQSWNHASNMTYVRNENYWDADSVSVTTLNVMLTTSDVTAYTAYQAGNLDFIDSIPNDELATAMQSDEFRTIDELGTYYFGFNYNSDLYANLGLDEEQAKVFRHAICLLIDRQYIVDSIGQTGQVAASTFIPAEASDGNGGVFEAANPDGYYAVTDYEGNVEEAKSLLASIGLWDESTDALTRDVSFTYLTNNSERNVRIAEAIQADLAQVGIDMTIDQQEWNVFLDTRKGGDFDAAREGWVMDYDDPINMLEMWCTQSGNNDCQFGRDSSKSLDWDAYDDLITRIRNTADPAERAELMHQAEDMLMDTWCFIPLYYYNDPYMVKDNVKGIYGTGLGLKYFYHAVKE